MVEKALLGESLAGSESGWGLTGSKVSSTDSELGGGSGVPSPLPCPRKLKRRMRSSAVKLQIFPFLGFLS